MIVWRRRRYNVYAIKTKSFSFRKCINLKVNGFYVTFSRAKKKNGIGENESDSFKIRTCDLILWWGWKILFHLFIIIVPCVAKYKLLIQAKRSLSAKMKTDFNWHKLENVFVPILNSFNVTLNDFIWQFFFAQNIFRTFLSTQVGDAIVNF